MRSATGGSEVRFASVHENLVFPVCPSEWNQWDFPQNPPPPPELTRGNQHVKSKERSDYVCRSYVHTDLTERRTIGNIIKMEDSETLSESCLNCHTVTSTSFVFKIFENRLFLGDENCLDLDSEGSISYLQATVLDNAYRCCQIHRRLSQRIWHLSVVATWKVPCWLEIWNEICANFWSDGAQSKIILLTRTRETQMHFSPSVFLTGISRLLVIKI